MMLRYKLYIIFFLGLIMGCKNPEARKPIQYTSGSFVKTSVQRNKELIAREEEAIKKIIQQDSLHHYHASENGFWYTYLSSPAAKDLQTAKYGDNLSFKYDISTLEGNPIYTKEEIGERTYLMDKENLFSGMRQALKLMKEGEKVRFYFPSHTAFGYYGDNHKIETNIPIRCDVELLKIEETTDTNK